MRSITIKKEWARRDRKTKQKKLIALLGGKCVRCQKTDSLQFDHIDPKTKVCNISAIMDRSWDTILQEATKCQLLCEGCHRLKTREDIGYQDIPIIVTITCEYCGQEKERPNRYVRRSIREGQTVFYCSRSCMGKDFWKRYPDKRQKPFEETECGSHTKYTRGCRCVLCTQAHRDYQNQYRRNKRILT